MKKCYYILFLISFLFINNSCKKDSNQTEPVQTFATGLIESNNLTGYSFADVPSSGPTPASFDLSSKMPSVKNQGEQGSCVGFACMYVKSYHEYSEKKLTQYTESDIMSPSFIYNQSNAYILNNQGTNCRNIGTIYVDALNLLKI